MITAGDFRNGKTFEYEGKLMMVVEFQHVKPGKGAAFVRTKMKNIVTGAVTETSFNPTAKFEEAFIDRIETTYSYNDGDLYYFMDNETFEMTPVAKGDLPENFKTPFFATNFSGFWNRWHISFSSWLQDYLFMPLAWADISPLTRGRRERLPVWFCLFCVFFVSGFWHGNTLPFVVWGILQAVYRIGEEMLHQRLGKPKKRAPAAQLWGKRAVVFVLWTFSMVFFRVGSDTTGLGMSDCFGYLAGCVSGLSPARFVSELYSAVYNGFYPHALMVAAYYVLVLAGLALAFRLDVWRAFACKNRPSEQALAAMPHRRAIYYLLIVFILAGLIVQNGGFGGSNFSMYAGF